MNFYVTAMFPQPDQDRETLRNHVSSILSMYVFPEDIV